VSLGVEKDRPRRRNRGSLDKAKDLEFVSDVAGRRESMPFAHETAQRHLPAAAVRAPDVKHVHAAA